MMHLRVRLDRYVHGRLYIRPCLPSIFRCLRSCTFQSTRSRDDYPSAIRPPLQSHFLAYLAVMPALQVLGEDPTAVGP